MLLPRELVGRVAMPVTAAMTRLLNGQTTVAETVALPMGRNLRDE